MAVPSYRFIASKLAAPSVKTRAPISTIKPSSVSFRGLTPKPYSLLINNRIVKDILKNDLNISGNKSTKAFAPTSATDSTSISPEDILNRLRILNLLALLLAKRAQKRWRRITIPLQIAGLVGMGGVTSLQLYNAMRMGDALDTLSDPEKLKELADRSIISPILRRFGVRDDLTVLQAAKRRWIPPVKSWIKAGAGWADSKALLARKAVKAGYNTFKGDVNKVKEYSEKKVSTTNDRFKKYLLGLEELLNNPTLRRAPYQSPTLYDYPQ